MKQESYFKPAKINYVTDMLNIEPIGTGELLIPKDTIILHFLVLIQR